MLATDQIQTSLLGAWRLMLGRPDGFRLLDLSADGFWNSFFAMVVAVPALAVGWVAVADEMGDPAALADRFGVFARIAVVDLGSWVLPLVGLGLVARRLGLGGRFVHYVVATNWASAIAAWIMLPAAILRLFVPGPDPVSDTVLLIVILLILVLMWRVTNVAIAKGAAVGTAVFAGMFVASLLVQSGLQKLLGF